MQVKVTGKTRNGKNIIQLHGDTFEVIKIAASVAFDSKSGPWFLLESLNNTFKKEKHLHWIREKEDPDFNIVARDEWGQNICDAEVV